MNQQRVKSFTGKNYVNRKFHSVVYAAVEEDFKAYHKNAEDYAAGNAEIDTELISRLRWAVETLDKKKILEIGKPHMLENAFLSKYVDATVKEIVDAFHCEKDGMVKIPSLDKSDNIIAIKLFQKNALDLYAICNEPTNMNPDELRKVIQNKLSCISLVQTYGYDKIDQALINAEMVQYHCLTHFATYEEMADFYNKWQSSKKKRTVQESEIRLWTTINDDNIKSARLFIEQHKDYKPTQSNPLYAIFNQVIAKDEPAEKDAKDSKNDKSFFTNYPITNEEVKTNFEKSLLNKKDRFFNSEQRIQAMSASLFAAFVYQDFSALLRALKYIAAAGQTTNSSTEKSQIMGTITPESLINMIFRSCKLGEFNVSFVEACKEFAKIYFSYPDALKAAKKSFEANVPTTLLQYVIDTAKTPELGADLQLCLDGLMQIADVIPSLSYSV